MELRIKDILKEKGITSKSFSASLGMTEVGLSNIVTGKASPSLKRLEEIALALGVPFVELFQEPQQSISPAAKPLTCPHCGKAIAVEIVTG